MPCIAFTCGFSVGSDWVKGFRAHLKILHRCPVKAALEECRPISVEKECGAGVQGHICGREGAPCKPIQTVDKIKVRCARLPLTLKEPLGFLQSSMCEALPAHACQTMQICRLVRQCHCDNIWMASAGVRGCVKHLELPAQCGAGPS